MATMKSKTFIAKVKDIAENYNTLYVKGCFGAPLTGSNVSRYCTNNSYNKASARTAMIKAVADKNPPYYGFDCVCLIKGVLWGWTGDKSKTYGGATYASNSVPDVNADGMIAKCSDVSTNFSGIIPGEAVWMSGHIGIYIGDGLAVECTPKWTNSVQITAVGNIGSKSGYNKRIWTKHGKLPYVDYSDQSSTSTKTTTASSSTTTVKATEAAKSGPSSSVKGTYKVTASALNVRYGAGTSKSIMTTIPKDTSVTCYGYYTTVSGTKWLFVAFTYKNVYYEGFASSKYLAKS